MECSAEILEALKAVRVLAGFNLLLSGTIGIGVGLLIGHLEKKNNEN